MAITIDGTAGTIAGLVAGGLPDGIVDGDMLASGAITSVAMPTGSVLQVVSTTKSDVFSVSSSTFTEITGLTATITPTSASSKVMVFLTIGGATSGGYSGGRLYRDSTQLAVGQGATNYNSSFPVTFYDHGNPDSFQSGSLTYLDSPNTTSAITYSIKVSNASANAIFINHCRIGRVSGSSSITVMEISG